MQSLEVYYFMDFCNQLLQDLICRNFLQGNNVQKRVWSTPLQRYTQMDSK
jgi:hypothetical protein